MENANLKSTIGNTFYELLGEVDSILANPAIQSLASAYDAFKVSDYEETQALLKEANDKLISSGKYVEGKIHELQELLGWLQEQKQEQNVEKADAEEEIE